jgi:PTH1 family peptidyl-tRNA hydrolase
MRQRTTITPVIIAGLGNPGEQYAQTPHSAGFMVIDGFAKRFDFPDFIMEPDDILVSKKEIGSKTVILAKPQMFMNNSGKALAKLFSRQKIRKTKPLPNLWIINDDLDIPLGKIKISQNRGAAGHKGVQSIIDTFKTKNFVRFRAGIAPQSPEAKKIPADKYVLKKIAPSEQPKFDEAISSTISAISLALSSGLEKSMTEFNQ